MSTNSWSMNTRSRINLVVVPCMIERARWRPRQTQNKYFTQLSNLSLLTINCEQIRKIYRGDESILTTIKNAVVFPYHRAP